MNLLVIDRLVSPGIPGNEQADHLAKTAGCPPYIGLEPALPIPYNSVKTAIRQWAYVQVY